EVQRWAAGDGRRPWSVASERDLPEVGAAFHRGAPAPLRVDGNDALVEDLEPFAWLSLPDDGRLRRLAKLHQLRREALDGRRSEGCEHRDAAEQLDALRRDRRALVDPPEASPDERDEQPQREARHDER